jgi:hypothetical protein
VTLPAERILSQDGEQVKAVADRVLLPVHLKKEVVNLDKDSSVEIEGESVAVFESRMCDEFVQYMERLHGQRFLLVNHVSKEVYPCRASSSSRYTKRGQDRIKSKIKDCLGEYYVKAGVKLELTFDQKKISRPDAWECIDREITRMMDGLNKIRMRKHRGLIKLSYVRVLESQKNGYPHAHIVFPGFRSLMVDKDDIEAAWGHGFIWVRFCGAMGPASYACKYISKMDLFPLMLAYLRHYRLRVYSFSRSFRYRKFEHKYGWTFVSALGSSDLNEKMEGYSNEGYFVHGPVSNSKHGIQIRDG